MGNGEKVLPDNLRGFSTSGVLSDLMGKSGAERTTLIGIVAEFRLILFMIGAAR